MAAGESRNYRSRSAADIEDPRLLCGIQTRIAREKRPCAGFIPAGVKLDEAVIDVREYIIVAPPPQP